jgi:hypothetical protein
MLHGIKMGLADLSDLSSSICQKSWIDIVRLCLMWTLGSIGRGRHRKSKQDWLRKSDRRMTDRQYLRTVQQDLVSQTLLPKRIRVCDSLST